MKGIEPPAKLADSHDELAKSLQLIAQFADQAQGDLRDKNLQAVIGWPQTLNPLAQRTDELRGSWRVETLAYARDSASMRRMGRKGRDPRVAKLARAFARHGRHLNDEPAATIPREPRAHGERVQDRAAVASRAAVWSRCGLRTVGRLSRRCGTQAG